MMKAEQEDITPNYLNKKLESMMAAVFDHIGETEERIKNLEKEIFKLRNAFLKINFTLATPQHPPRFYPQTHAVRIRLL
mgnify:CR=1 FL=1